MYQIGSAEFDGMRQERINELLNSFDQELPEKNLLEHTEEEFKNLKKLNKKKKAEKTRFFTEAKAFLQISMWKFSRKLIIRRNRVQIPAIFFVYIK